MGSFSAKAAWIRSAIGFARDERAATAIEYGLIASLIFLVALGAMSSTGGGVSSAWQTMGNKVNAALRSNE
jgi:pilus assembly protein Flp/PilA